MNPVEIAPGVTMTAIGGEKFKRFKIGIHAILPGQRETATAMAVLPHLLERRCEAVPDPMALSRRLYDLYGAELAGESYTAGQNRVLTFGVSGVKNAYALEGEDLAGESLALLLELLFRPKLSAAGVFEEEDAAIEVAKQADFLRNEMNDKRGYCLRQARRKLYGDSPLGIESAGYLEDIEALTPTRLYEVYRQVLETARFHVVVCGADADAVKEKITACMAGVKRAPVQPAPLAAAAGTQSFEAFEEPMDTVQGKLCILCTCGKIEDTRGEAVMRMASAVLGGLPTSRLFQNVREKQSLCYYCVSVWGGFSGTLQMDSGVDHAMAAKAADAMLEQLRILQNELITGEELENARKALANSFASAKDSADALAGWAFNEWLRGTNQTLDEAVALLDGVTREDIRAALQSFVPALQYTITAKQA